MKNKHDSPEPNSSAWRFLFPVFVVLALVAVTTIVILALIGPTVGNIFSNISKGLSRDGGSGGGGYSSSVSSAVYPTVEYRPSTPLPVINQQPVLMKAGDIDDNAQWDTYTQFRRDFVNGPTSQSIIDLDITDRRIIKVVDLKERPILGAQVDIYLDQTRISSTLTYATGLTLFFPNADERSRRHDVFEIFVTAQQYQVHQTIDLRSVGDIEIQMPILATSNPTQPATRQQVKLDVAFVMDTTGSMGDELAQLQTNVRYIADSINRWDQNIDVQYGLVAYRDQGDEYVTQISQFTSDANQFQVSLSRLSAGGGGDTPEDLAKSLEVTLHQLAWRGNDTIQLVFVITDAPAQLYGGFTYMDSVKEAATHGIKIHSLAASGLDLVGEYMLRQMAQITMGRFIFLTYDSSAPVLAPGDDRADLTVGEVKDETGRGEYTVELLPQLVLRLIREEVTHVNTEQ